jgi:Leucine-rich repeat (LRR) protein
MVSKKQKNSLNSSNFMKSVIMMTISSLVSVQVLPVSAQQIRTVSFVEWCQQRNSLPIDTRESIILLLKATETKNCQVANDRLKNTTFVKLRNSNIGDLKPLASLLVSFSNLKSIDLSDNNINDLKPLATLSNLKSINLDQNDISDLKPLARLNRLESISIYKNQVSDLKPLAGLRNLTFLNLSYNKIHDVKVFAALVNLTELYICGNRIDDVKPIHNLNKLNKLNICGNSSRDFYNSGRAVIANINRLQIEFYAEQGIFIENVEKLNTELKYKPQNYNIFVHSFGNSNSIGNLLVAKTIGAKSYLGLLALSINTDKQRVIISTQCVSNRPNQILLPNTLFQQEKDGSLSCPKGWSKVAPLYISGT